MVDRMKSMTAAGGGAPPVVAPAKRRRRTRSKPAQPAGQNTGAAPKPRKRRSRSRAVTVATTAATTAGIASAPASPASLETGLGFALAPIRGAEQGPSAWSYPARAVSLIETTNGGFEGLSDGDRETIRLFAASDDPRVAGSRLRDRAKAAGYAIVLRTDLPPRG